MEPRGVYSQIPGADVWDETRDARLYPGPLPVVAHPPCQRWSVIGRRHGTPGADSGCFEAALAAVERWGGVIEHPQGSGAWAAYGLVRPVAGEWTPVPRRARWPAWTTVVEQGHYGHRARKVTWLYLVSAHPLPVIWGPSVASIGPRPGRDPARERRIGAVQRMGLAERIRTPRPFADLLIALAAS